MSCRSVTVRVLLFAAVGAAATVAVAALPFLRFDGSFTTGFADGVKSRRSEDWPWPVPSGWPSARVNVWRTDRFGYRWEEASRYVMRRNILTNPETWESAWRSVRVACGWPRPVVTASRHYANPSVHLITVPPPLVAEAGYAPPVAGIALPVEPLWPGFLVDTVFWGGAAFVVWSVPGFVRRRVRRRRGRCVRCGYELKGLAVCPECGGGSAS